MEKKDGMPKFRVIESLKEDSHRLVELLENEEPESETWFMMLEMIARKIGTKTHQITNIRQSFFY